MVLHRRAPAPVQRVQAVSQPAIGLYVQHDGPALRLRWNPDTAAIRDAHSGVLVIADGARQSRLELKQPDLRTGVASYWPESREVIFRLALDGAAAGEIRASADTPVEPRPSPFDSGGRRPETTIAARPAPRSSADDETGEDDPPPPSMVTYFTARTAPVRARTEKDAPPAVKASTLEPPPPPPAARVPKAAAVVSADRQVEEAPAPESKKESRWRRVTGKIPLLRRLAKH
jgi:hypothetical protein